MNPMKLALVAAAAVSLAACSTLPGVGGSAAGEVAKGVLSNLEHCDRTYTAAIGAGGGGSLNVSCKARPYDPAVPSPAPVAASAETPAT